MYAPIKAVSLALVATLVSCHKTALEFRSPAGSSLFLDRAAVNPAREVTFVSRVVFTQVHGQSSDSGSACRGEIRIDGQVDLTRLPPEAKSYLLERDSHVYIRVHGYYWIYRFDQTTTDELSVHYVDIAPLQIYQLLEGRAVTLEGIATSGELIFRFQLGIELPDEAR